MDHSIEDLVSEFVWIRPPASSKRFYVRDPVTGEKHLVGTGSAVKGAGANASDGAAGIEDGTNGGQGGEGADREVGSGEDGEGGEGAAGQGAGEQGNAGFVCWFDDHMRHNIEPMDSAAQYSLRVDGRFTPQFRDLICRTGTFADESLRGVLAKQGQGPVFLGEPNSPPPSDDEEEDEDEEEEGEEGEGGQEGEQGEQGGNE